MRNVNMTQDMRYKYKFEQRLKNEDYLEKINLMIEALKSKDIENIYKTFEVFSSFSTKGLSSQIRKILVNTEKRIYVIKDLTTTKGENEILDNVYEGLIQEYNELKNELISKMI